MKLSDQFLKIFDEESREKGLDQNIVTCKWMEALCNSICHIFDNVEFTHPQYYEERKKITNEIKARIEVLEKHALDEQVHFCASTQNNNVKSFLSEMFCNSGRHNIGLGVPPVSCSAAGFSSKLDEEKEFPIKCIKIGDNIGKGSEQFCFVNNKSKKYYDLNGCHLFYSWDNLVREVEACNDMSLSLKDFKIAYNKAFNIK